ncbi:hypothetical protein ACFPRL_32860 [Pseudoclavibacter helvolus]
MLERNGSSTAFLRSACGNAVRFWSVHEHMSSFTPFTKSLSGSSQSGCRSWGLKPPVSSRLRAM